MFHCSTRSFYLVVWFCLRCANWSVCNVHQRCTIFFDFFFSTLSKWNGNCESLSSSRSVSLSLTHSSVQKASTHRSSQKVMTGDRHISSVNPSYRSNTHTHTPTTGQGCIECTNKERRRKNTGHRQNVMWLLQWHSGQNESDQQQQQPS